MNLFPGRSNSSKVFSLLLTSILIITFLSCGNDPKIEGEMKKWHTATITLKGPEVSENTNPNPFLDYKLTAKFIHTRSGTQYTIPGYFAADGNAAHTGSSSGNKWKVKFCPNKTGEWKYKISFLKGKNIAVNKDNIKAKKLSLDGKKGSFIVEESDKSGHDFRNKGKLKYSQKGYLQFSDTMEYFLKGGANSPENFLAYNKFDGTYFGGEKVKEEGESAPNPDLHSYTKHKKDWNEDDPTWQNGKGKEIIGALNYLAEQNMNSVYFLTLNIEGDGEDVWPYTRRNERYRFDCSKLAQWDIIFSHMNKKGILPHFVLQETENECLLDAGYLGDQRKLYLRELVARFSHHPGVMWNLGEEHGPVEWAPYGQTPEDTKEMAEFLHNLDPYDHPVVVHTHSTNPDRTKLIKPYLGNEYIDGISLQCAQPEEVNHVVKKWSKTSEDSSKKWLVSMDEIGPYQKGVVPDNFNSSHDTLRSEVLWGSLMAGAAGIEWYFGSEYPHNDLSCENWRTRENIWEQTDIAKTFFEKYLPYWEMSPSNNLISNDQAYCFAKEDSIYAIYLPDGNSTKLKLTKENNFEISWYNPRKGGELINNENNQIRGPGYNKIGTPPEEKNKDWVALIRRIR